jgi:hypothetical protein
MTHYPIMFAWRDVVSGNGYLAGVTLYGTALMAKEDDGKWWSYGVRPGAIAEYGETAQVALNKFHERYKMVLYDFAEEAMDFSAFKNEVEKFYAQPEPEDEARWLEAVLAIRHGKVAVEPPFSELPRENPEKRPTGVSIQSLNEMQRFTPMDNVLDTYECVAAA